MQLRLRLLKNVLANYVGAFVTIVTGLLLTPFMIRSLGDTGYGIWALASSILAYFTLLDRGLADALAKYTAEYAVRGDQATINRLASTLFVFLGGIGAIVFLVIFALSSHFAGFFNVPADYLATAQVALIVLGFALAVSLPLTVFNALAVGYQQYRLLNGVVATTLLLNAGLTVLVLNLGWGVVGLAGVALFTAVVRPLLLWVALRRWEASSLQLRPSLFDPHTIRRLLTYSLFMLVMFACIEIEVGSSNIIVGRLVSVEEVTSYAIGLKMSGFLANLVMPLTSVFFPAFSALSITTDRQKMSRLLAQGMRVTVVLAGLLTGLLVVFARPLVALWIGPGHENSVPVVVILALQAFLYRQSVFGSTLLQGTGHLKRLAGIHIVAAVLDVGLSLALVGRLGVRGVALGTLLAWTVAYVVLLPYVCQVAGISFASLAKEALLAPLVSLSLTFGLMAFVASVYPPANVTMLIVQTTATVAIFGALFLGLGVSRQERTAYLNLVKQLL